MPKTYKFAVATAGKTIDGREITKEQIDQMAQSYDREVYSARIWLEHYRSIMPDGSFKAYGDVISLSAAENNNGQYQLFAEIKPLPELIEINKKKQKLYSSIEIAPNFQDTGKAYLSGLAVTDSPASTGTQELHFNINKGAKLVSDYQEFTADFAEESILEKVKKVFSSQDIKIDKLDEQAKILLKELTSTAEFMATELEQTKQQVTSLNGDLASLKDKFNKLSTSLDTQPNFQPSRPTSDGSDEYQSDC